MDIYVREKEFEDKKKNEKVKYSEFYLKFHVQVTNDKVEDIEIVLKFDDKYSMAKSLLKMNLDVARFDINTKVTEKGVYYNPVVVIPVGNKDYNVPVKLTPSDVTLIRIAFSQDIRLGF